MDPIQEYREEITADIEVVHIKGKELKDTDVDYETK